MTVSAAKEALDLPGKGLGSIAGALAKKAKIHGMSLPYSATRTPAGERIWNWRPSVARKLGIPEQVVEEVVEKEPVEAPVAKRAAFKKKAPAPQEPLSWEQFFNALPEQTRTFIGLVQARSRLTMSSAQEALGIPEEGVTEVVDAFAEQAVGSGFDLPYTSVKTKTGQRMWIWRPAVAKELGITA